GKTTIVKCLKEGLAQITSLQPTIGVEYNELRFLDHYIITHDLGGQKKDLINYLRNPAQYYDATEICIFVIDVKDVQRYDVAVLYVKDVLDKFMELEITPYLFFLFHKAENSILKAEKEEEIHIAYLQEKLELVVEKRFPTEFYRTSVHDQWSIKKAFSRVFSTFYPTMDALTKLALKGVIETLNLKGAVLVDASGLMIGSEFKKPDASNLVAYVVPSLFHLKQRLLDAKIEVGVLLLEINDDEYGFLRLEEKDITAFLCLIAGKKQFPSQEDFKKLANLLPNLLISLGIKL
nr:ADP-ribosylation factor-like protein [Candidatus Sigynarchaeota archaeon]